MVSWCGTHRIYIAAKCNLVSTSTKNISKRYTMRTIYLYLQNLRNEEFPYKKRRKHQLLEPNISFFVCAEGVTKCVNGSCPNLINRAVLQREGGPDLPT